VCVCACVCVCVCAISEGGQQRSPTLPVLPCSQTLLQAVFPTTASSETLLPAAPAGAVAVRALLRGRGGRGDYPCTRRASAPAPLPLASMPARSRACVPPASAPHLDPRDCGVVQIDVGAEGAVIPVLPRRVAPRPLCLVPKVWPLPPAQEAASRRPPPIATAHRPRVSTQRYATLPAAHWLHHPEILRPPLTGCSPRPLLQPTGRMQPLPEAPCHQGCFHCQHACGCSLSHTRVTNSCTCKRTCMLHAHTHAHPHMPNTAPTLPPPGRGGC